VPPKLNIRSEIKHTTAEAISTLGCPVFFSKSRRRSVIVIIVVMEFGRFCGGVENGERVRRGLLVHACEVQLRFTDLIK